MFEILRKSIKTGVVTTAYPKAPAEHAPNVRGCPDIDYPKWKDARVAAAACPTGALACQDQEGQRAATLDLGLCTFCGLCAEADPAIRMTKNFELVARKREHLRSTVRYRLNPDSSHRSLVAAPFGEKIAALDSQKGAISANPSVEELGQAVKAQLDRFYGRSLHIREVDAGSCNGCEIEIVGLNSPVYDLERFGIHFVASPRHADMLLVTGPVSRNMELALKKTYEAMPPPRRVVAAGACACSGGIFGKNYASLGGVDHVLPVDVYIPGCPPNPYALLHGILAAIGRV